MKLPLYYYNHPILRKQSTPVGKITDDIRQLCFDMIESMLAYKGIGLAAPQVGHLLRIFVSNVDFEDEKGEIHLGEPVVFINPILSNPSDVFVEREEGCLSIPGLYEFVKRPSKITVEAKNLEGNSFKKECYGYHARNIMHENDHLNGTLFIDRIKGKRRTLIEPKLLEIKQKYFQK
ncbi:MAG: peptide deformylase [Chlamydiales bacterium]